MSEATMTYSGVMRPQDVVAFMRRLCSRTNPTRWNEHRPGTLMICAIQTERRRADGRVAVTIEMRSASPLIVREGNRVLRFQPYRRASKPFSRLLRGFSRIA
jgi:hypothetical protein